MTQVETLIGDDLTDHVLENGGCCRPKTAIKSIRSTIMLSLLLSLFVFKISSFSAAVQSIGHIFVFAAHYRQQLGSNTVGACVRFCSGTNQRLDGSTSILFGQTSRHCSKGIYLNKCN